MRHLLFIITLLVIAVGRYICSQIVPSQAIGRQGGGVFTFESTSKQSQRSIYNVNWVGDGAESSNLELKPDVPGGYGIETVMNNYAWGFIGTSTMNIGG